MPSTEIETAANRIAAARLNLLNAELVSVSLPIYWDQLNAHDWDYAWSRDPSVFKAGQTRKEELSALATLSPEHHALFDGFESYHSARAYQLANVPPKPERPL